MSLPWHPGIFATVERQFVDNDPTPPLRLFGRVGTGRRASDPGAGPPTAV